uniref:Uncharacterized protein n=1 Tax=Rhizophagus irregularis (strain DAOM 181602 / DAOM 197198 / MUCL 43194) TaxID=747089 RepID=U9UVI6_RHIID
MEKHLKKLDYHEYQVYQVEAEKLFFFFHFFKSKSKQAFLCKLFRNARLESETITDSMRMTRIFNTLYILYIEAFSLHYVFNVTCCFKVRLDRASYRVQSFNKINSV